MGALGKVVGAYFLFFAYVVSIKRTLRKLVPNIPLQALVRGANGVGYTSYPWVKDVPPNSQRLSILQ